MASPKTIASTKAADSNKQGAQMVGNFSIVSIEETTAPDGGQDGSWYRYVVARDNSEIVGSMQGNLQQVTRYVNEFVEKLNDRGSSPTGHSYWAPSPSHKTPPRKT